MAAAAAADTGNVDEGVMSEEANVSKQVAPNISDLQEITLQELENFDVVWTSAVATVRPYPLQCIMCASHINSPLDDVVHD